MMRLKPISRLVFIACVLLGIAVTSLVAETATSTTYAQSPTPTPSIPSLPLGGGDFVIMIDQSGSMWDPTARPQPPNDPDEKRFFATKHVLDRLALDAIFNPKHINRFTVLTFAQTTNIPPDIDITVIQNPIFDEWQAKSGQLTNPLGKWKGYGTHFESVFERAKEAFQKPFSTPPPGNAGPRQKVLMLITDGCPAIDKTINGLRYISEEDWARSPESRQGNQYPNWKNYYQRWVNGYMTNMTNYFQEQFGKDYFLYIIAINDSAGDDYWNLCGTHWDKMIALAHPGSKTESRVQKDRIERFAFEMFTTVLPPENTPESYPWPSNLQDARAVVRPYLDKVVLTFFKERAEANIFLYRKAGDSTTLVRDNDPDIIEHKKYSSSERWIINRPNPGVWGFKKEGASEVIIYEEQIPIKVQLGPVTPVGQGSSVTITLNLLEPGNKPLDIDANYDPQYRLSVQAMITAPNGTAMRALPAVTRVSTDTYAMKGVLFDQVGNYKVSVVGTASVPQTSTTTSTAPTAMPIFRDEGTIQVYEIKSFGYQVDEPKQATVFGLHGGIGALFALQSIPVKVRLISGGQAIPVANALHGDPNQAFEARLVGPNGITETLALQFDSKQNLFVAEMGKKLDAEGNYTLTVSFKGNIQPLYRAAMTTSTITFERRDNLFDKPGTWAGLGFLIVLAIAGVIGYGVYATSNPAVGELEFEGATGISLGVSIALAPRHRRTVKISKGELTRKYGALGLGEIIARRAPPEMDGDPAGVLLWIKDLEGNELAAEERLEDKKTLPLKDIRVRYRG